MRLFEALLSLIFPPRRDERRIARAEADALFLKVAPSHFSLLGVEGTGLLPYKDSLVAAYIREAKFHTHKEAVSALGAVLADHLMERVADETAFGGKLILVPIPLGETRQNERGYNQVEEICRAALVRLGDSVTLMSDALVRTRDTLPQTKLSRSERLKNMRGAFKASTGLNQDHRYILIDDVVTTGATLLAATETLRAAGVKNVSVLALAH